MTPAQLKFLKIIQKKDYFSGHQRVLVALSGGQDSMTLFHWLYELREKLGIELGIAHINHGLRVESVEEEAYIRKMGADFGISVYVDEFTGRFTEAGAREFRYAFFEKIMREKGFTALVTAHHKGDVIETFLMREIMGRGLRSLQGIAERQPFANGQLIRPLLKFEKSELTTPIFFEDVTNTGTDYFRNRVRNVLIPQLSEENPQFSEAIFGLSSEIDLAMQVISEKISDLEIVNEKIDLARFCEQSEAFQHFILQAYFAQFPELKITKAKFEELLHLIRRPQQFRGSLNKNVNFIKTKMEFYIEKNKKSALTDLSVTFENPQDDSYQVIYLPEHGEVEIRKRQPGDEILIKGHHKKLRKFFIEYQVPLEKRENPLIFVDNHLYAIVDVMCSDLSNSAKNDKMRRTLWAKAQSKRGN